MERRIVLYGPGGRDAVLAERVLQSAGIEVAHCVTEADLGARLAEGVGALMMAEEMLPGPAIAMLAGYLQRQPPWADLPILLLTKHGADSLEAQRGFEQLGNVTLIERPVRTMALVSAVRSALRARDRQYEMRALDRRKDEFLAALAHELRNPLAPITNAMSIVRRMHPTPEVQKLGGIVDRQMHHLKRLIDDLLDVARITHGKLELHRSMTSVDQVVTNAVEIAQQAMEEKRHRLRIEKPSRDVELHADHVRLVQSVANLLVNAAKFTPPAGDIVLAVEAHAPEVSFSVRDNGKGLDAAFLNQIFHIFAQSRTLGEPTSGLGLGLHLTRAFAQLHGGTLVAHSDGPGKGSEFKLTVPVMVDRAVAAPRDAAAVPAQPAGPLGRILVVDDNVDAASTLAALLSLQGAIVAIAHDGAQALAAVRAQRPDAVLMDIGMPVMNGYEAARAIRSEFGPGTPTLIALTGWGQYSDKARAVEAGFDMHFTKPLEVDELLASLPSPGAVRSTAAH